MPDFRVTQREVLTRGEVLQLLGACDDPGDYLFCRLGVYGGLRISEILNLEFGDVIRDGKRVALHIRDSKGGKSRYACIDHATADLLRLTPYPWFNYTSRTYQRRVKELCDRAGIVKDISPHTLRHTNITMLLSRGMSLEKVRIHAGHEKIETTMVYIHLVYEPIAAAYEEAVGY